MIPIYQYRTIIGEYRTILITVHAKIMPDSWSGLAVNPVNGGLDSAVFKIK
jgi:hypothetical protein